MKTKNIFRMLLVAAALLMGANNVKADETTVWEGPTTNSDYDAVDLSLSDFTSKGAAKGKKLRVYARLEDGWKIEIKSAWGNSLGFTDWQGDPDGKMINNSYSSAYDTTNKRFEMTIGDGFFNNITENQGFQIQCWHLYVDRITLYSGGSTTEPTTYSITIPDDIEHGSVTAKASGEAGETITLSVRPASGYELATLTVKDASNNDIAVSEDYKFTMPASNVTVNATFTQSYSVPEGSERHELTFNTDADYHAANWNENTNTFSWGPGYQSWGQPEWTFMAANNINGNLSNWTHLHLHVSDWTNVSAKELKVVFKSGTDNNGPTKEIMVYPNASGNIDIDLPPSGEWGNVNGFDITNIFDLTIYGCSRVDESQVASVVVTDAYYVTAAAASETYSITIPDNIENGRVTANKTSNIKAGDLITLSVTPDTGYELATLTVKDASNNDVSVSEDYTFTMPASNVTISATFSAVQQELPTLHAGENIVWNGDYDEWLNNWENVIDLDPSMFKAANQQMTNATKTVRIYGTFNDDWAIELKHKTGSWSPLPVWVDKNTGEICNQANAGTVNITDLGNNVKYIEFPLSAETLQSIIRNDDVLFILQGIQIAVDKVVIYVAEPHTITYTVDGEHGGFANTNPTSATYGSTVTFSITVDEGWTAHVSATYGENETALTLSPTSNEQEYSFTMPDADVTVTLSFTQIVSKTVTIGEHGACTFSSEVAVIIPDGVTAYWAKEVSSNMVVLEPISGIIPAETGVVLLGETGSYTFTGTTGGTTINGNLLQPVLNESGITCDLTTQYVLTWHDRLVFAQTGAGIHAAEVAQGQAYLQLGSSSGSRLRLSIANGDDITGISSIESDERSLDGAIYNLRGQRVEHPVKGLYIINGRKVVIK